MKTQVAVPVPTELFLELVGFLKESGSDRDPVEVVWHAIDYWMENAGWKPEILAPHVTASRGYTWKYKDDAVFLPHGTELRMVYKGQTHYATVEGDEIKYNGESVSPATLANQVTNSSRNAWRDLWIKRPGDREWILADSCRKQVRAVKRELEKMTPDQLRALDF